MWGSDNCIILHKNIHNNPVCNKSPAHLSVWVFLLTKTYEVEKPALRGNKKIIVEPGQALISYREIEEKTKVPKSNAYRIVKFFEQEGLIEVDRPSGTYKKDEKALITVKSWDSYQKKWDIHGTESGTFQTQTTKGKTGKYGTDNGTANNNKDIYDRIVNDKYHPNRNDKKALNNYLSGMNAKQKTEALNKLLNHETMNSLGEALEWLITNNG